MVYNENFIVLDENEELEVLDEEILLEGEIALEETEVLDEAMILSASDIDTERSSKEISKVKASIDKAIASGKYRAYKSSDSALVDKTVKSKGMLKTAGMAIAGSIIGAGVGFGTSAGIKFGQRLDDNKLQNMASKNAKEAKRSKKYDAKYAFSGPEFDEYDKANKAKTTSLVVKEAVDMYLSNSFEYVLDETFIFNEEGKLAGIKSKAQKVGDDVKKAGGQTKGDLGKGDVIAAGAGAVAGAGAGAALARKIVSNMKYKVFSTNGLTILSFYTTDKNGQAKGNSSCYAIATSVDGNKLLMRRIELKSKK